jgi:hypothetical protein
MPARKRPTPKQGKPKTRPKPKPTKPTPKPAKTFVASGRTVAVRESNKSVAITIDGYEIPGVRKLADGEYHSEFLPFRGYTSAEELGRALAGHAESTFTLASGGHHAGDPARSVFSKKSTTKRTTRGHS